MDKNRLWDPGSGIEKIRIRDKHPRSATLLTTNTFVEKGPERAPWQELTIRSFALAPRVALSEAWILARLGLAAGQLKTKLI